VGVGKLVTWTCTVCHIGHPRGDVKSTVVGYYANGECDNLGCSTRKDKGSKKRPPRQTVFRSSSA
jgi:hypothetical protein